MQKITPSQTNSINLTDLSKLAKSHPQYTKLFLALTQIDSFIKQICKDTVSNITDSSIYSLKSEINSTSYFLYLYNIELDAIVGTTWPIGSFISECQSKTIEADVVAQTIKMVDRFERTPLETDRQVNWV